MGEANTTPRRFGKRARCAIYTRKSSEEGLDQAFNSLDAQREACAAFILSQKHEGWTASPAFYDDGGYSGGTMERPALKRLIADIEAGQIDVVVVYKVDRLTRALSDFARLVDVFDRRFGGFAPVADPQPRLFDIPWLVMDSGAARQRFGWRPLRNIESILEEIARHVRDNPGWLEQCGVV